MPSGREDLTPTDNVVNNVVTLSNSEKSKTFKVEAKTDAVSDSGETVKLKYQVKSDDSAYEGFVVPDTSFTINEVKAQFSQTALVYNASAEANTLKYDGLSNSATGLNHTSNIELTLNGDLSSQAKGSSTRRDVQQSTVKQTKPRGTTIRRQMSGAKYDPKGSSRSSAHLTHRTLPVKARPTRSQALTG